jgi:hypothetical protein
VFVYSSINTSSSSAAGGQRLGSRDGSVKCDGCLLKETADKSEHQVMFEIVIACRMVANITILYYGGTFGTLKVYLY